MTTHPLTLDRPLAIFDLESTGVDTTKDRIVEIAVVRLNPDGTVERKPAEGRRLINPGIPIPAEVTAIHGISDADVLDAPTFAQIARGLHAYLDGCDRGGFNVLGYDIPLLHEEFTRAGIDWRPDLSRVVDVGVIFKLMEPRTLAAAVSGYLGWTHTDAHSALADTVATTEVLFAQVARYPRFAAGISDLFLASRYDKVETPLDVGGKLYRDADGDACYSFGKEKDKKVRSNTGYAEWMLKSDFSGDTKRCLREELRRVG